MYLRIMVKSSLYLKLIKQYTQACGAIIWVEIRWFFNMCLLCLQKTNIYRYMSKVLAK